MPHKIKTVSNAILSHYNIQSHYNNRLLEDLKAAFYEAAVYAECIDYNKVNYLYIAYNTSKSYLKELYIHDRHLPRKFDIDKINQYNILAEIIYNLYCKISADQVTLSSVQISQELKDSMIELGMLFDSGEAAENFEVRTKHLVNLINEMLVACNKQFKCICSVVEDHVLGDADFNAIVYSALHHLFYAKEPSLDSSILGIEIYAKKLFNMLNAKVLIGPQLPTKTIKYLEYLSVIPWLSAEFREQCLAITTKSNQGAVKSIIAALEVLVFMVSSHDREIQFVLDLCDVLFKIKSAARYLCKSNLGKTRLDQLLNHLNIAEQYILSIIQSPDPRNAIDETKVNTIVSDLKHVFSVYADTHKELPKLSSVIISLTILIHLPLVSCNSTVRDISEQLEIHMFMLGIHDFLNKQAGPTELELVALTISLTHIAMKIHLDDPVENIREITSTMQYFKDCSSRSPATLDKIIRSCESYLIRNIFCNSELKTEGNDQVKFNNRSKTKLYIT